MSALQPFLSVIVPAHQAAGILPMSLQALRASHLPGEGWELIVAPEARDTQGLALASPLRIKGGTGRAASGALDPGLGRLLIGAGPVPSLNGTMGQIAKQPGVNACVIMAPRVDGMRPGLRAQLPVPSTPERERAIRRAQGQTQAPHRAAD